MATFDVSLYEPIGAVVTADSLTPTVDSFTPTADGGILPGAADFADAAVNANIIFADIYEPIAAAITADSVAYTADNATWPTADGGTLEGARDLADAEIIPAEAAVGGGYYPPPRPLPVEGVGFGILPQLEGEAFGIVIIAGVGFATLPKVIGDATGTIGIAGRSAGQIIVRATAIGERGTVGTAVAILKNVSIASDGTVGVCGLGSGAIVKFEATAIGRHDDDEAAIMTFLLAAA